MATDDDVVLYSVDGPVATILMNRPQVANAQNTALIVAVDAACMALSAFDRARPENQPDAE